MINFIDTGLDELICKSVEHKEHAKVMKEILVHGQHGEYYAKRPVNADTGEDSSSESKKQYVPMDMKQGTYVDHHGMGFTSEELYKHPERMDKKIEDYLSKWLFDENGKPKYQTTNLHFYGQSEDDTEKPFQIKNPGDVGDALKRVIKKLGLRAKLTSIQMSPGKKAGGIKHVEAVLTSLDKPKNADPEMTELLNKLQGLQLLQGYKISQFKDGIKITRK